MSATEEVLEQIPEAVVEDTIETVIAARNNPVLLVGVGLVAGTLGAFGGYKYAQKRLRMYYKDIADAEIAEAKSYYAHLRKDGNAADPETLLESLHGSSEVEAVRAHKQYSGEAPAATEEELMSDDEKDLFAKNQVDPRPPVEEVVTEVKKTRRHTFEGSAPTENVEFDYEYEVSIRSEDKPYVITHDEYYAAEKDYEQIDLTYYQGDNTLADAREQAVPEDEEDASVGSDNLTRFGHGSLDENIVFVRNDRIEADFEITRSFGKYSEEVLGFADEDEHTLKHSTGVRKFRNQDN